VVAQLARQLGVHPEALGNWIRQDEADCGERGLADRLDPELVMNFVDAQDFSVGLVLRVLDIAASTYCDWRKGRREPSRRARQDAEPLGVHRRDPRLPRVRRHPRLAAGVAGTSQPRGEGRPQTNTRLPGKLASSLSHSNTENESSQIARRRSWSSLVESQGRFSSLRGGGSTLTPSSTRTLQLDSVPIPDRKVCGKVGELHVWQ